MKASLRIAREYEKNIVDNLLQFYLDEISVFVAPKKSAEGRLIYPYLDHYWRNPQRYPFLISNDKQIAGFALVRREIDPSNGMEVAEISDFFILSTLRNHGIGGLTAVQLWDMFPGKWRLEVHKANQDALLFWKDTISKYTDHRFKQSNNAESINIEFRFHNTIRQS